MDKYLKIGKRTVIARLIYGNYNSINVYKVEHDLSPGCIRLKGNRVQQLTTPLYEFNSVCQNIQCYNTITNLLMTIFNKDQSTCRSLKHINLRTVKIL